MRRAILELRAFYATALGRAARDMILRKLVEAWDTARGLDVLGVGYATPYLEPFEAMARRTVAAMPAQQGVEVWPSGAPVRACLSGELTLPFPNALFDRVLLVHALEESEDPAALLAEVRRVLAPSGRAILAVANRRGVWARAESTPFGYGRPFTRTQLEDVVREAGLEPEAWSRAVYVPPHGLFAEYADVFEAVGSRLWSPISGVILLEAVKQTFAVRPKGAKAPAQVRPSVRPVPVGASRAG